MPEVVSEYKQLNDVLLTELFQEFGYCRKSIALKLNAAATAAIQIGTVLEAVDSTKAAVCTTGASAFGILLTHVPLADHIAADQTVVMLYRGPAMVKAAGITIDSAQLVAATAALLALGINLVAALTQYEEGL